LGADAKKITLKGRIPAPDGKKFNHHHYSYKTQFILMNNDIDVIRIISKQDFPGPGSYQPKTGLDKLGVYYVSNIE
jgi:hypothetical protein